MKAWDAEYCMLRVELEAQWQHTGKASGKLNALEMDHAQPQTENESLKRELKKRWRVGRQEGEGRQSHKP